MAPARDLGPGFGAAAAARLPVRAADSGPQRPRQPESPRGSTPTEPQAGPAPAEPQAEFGGSILKNNMEVEAAMELQRHLDKTGVHQVHTTYA